MNAVLVFIDGTICDTRQRNHLFGSEEFYSEDKIMDDIPTQGSVECLVKLSCKYEVVYIGARPNRLLHITKKWIKASGFPQGGIYLGETQEERLNLISQLKRKYSFTAGIGDRWDDNELHLALGCMSIILKEYEPNWNTVKKYIL
jgi:hypothetical protein